MLRLLGIVISIGLADSLNPSTIAPALYLASGADARRTCLAVHAAVFLVYFLGGALIGLGPGQLVLSLVPKPDAATRHILEVVAGAILIAGGLVLWRYRGRLGRKRLPTVDPEGRASWLLGATITAVELPTAFPYFGAIAAIVGSGMRMSCGSSSCSRSSTSASCCHCSRSWGRSGWAVNAPSAGWSEPAISCERHWPMLLARGGPDGGRHHDRARSDRHDPAGEDDVEEDARLRSSAEAARASAHPRRRIRARAGRGSSASPRQPGRRPGHPLSPRKSAVPGSQARACAPPARAGGG